MQQTTTRGFILLFALMVTSIAVIIVTYITTRSAMYTPFMSIVQKREKAKWLAFGGIQLAMSQLTYAAEPKSEESATLTSEKKQDPLVQQKNILTNIVPLLGRWQIVPLRTDIEGVDGQIKLCVMSEQGKLNINELYDFKTHKFVNEGKKEGDAKKLLESVFSVIQKSSGGTDLFKTFENFLRSRQYKLQDVTELLVIPGFDVLQGRIWYEPADKQEAGADARVLPLYLTDMFTVWTGEQYVDPWMLSDSLSGVLGVKHITQKNKEQVAKVIGESVKKLKETSNWSTDWDSLLTPLYEQKYTSLSAHIKPFLRAEFEPQIFSVLSYGTVADVTQRLYGVLERVTLPTPEKAALPKGEAPKKTGEEKKKQTQPQKKRFIFKIKKLYWL